MGKDRCYKCQMPYTMKTMTIFLKRILPFLIIAGLFFTCELDMEVSPDTTGKGGSMARFTILGDYLYVVDNENLKVFSIANPASPEYVKTVPIGFEIETIFPFKNRLFVGSKSAVYFFSVTDPANPVQVSEAIEPTIVRRCDPVVAKDTVAFATLNVSGPCGGMESQLVVYNIKDIEHPKKMANRLLSAPNGLGYKDSVLYVCDYNQLKIFNIGNAWNPVELKSISHGVYKDVIPFGDLLICWTKTGMLIYNISAPTSPELIEEIL